MSCSAALTDVCSGTACACVRPGKRAGAEKAFATINKNLSQTAEQMKWFPTRFSVSRARGWPAVCAGRACVPQRLGVSWFVGEAAPQSAAFHRCGSASRAPGAQQRQQGRGTGAVPEVARAGCGRKGVAAGTCMCWGGGRQQAACPNPRGARAACGERGCRRMYEWSVPRGRWRG